MYCESRQKGEIDECFGKMLTPSSCYFTTVDSQNCKGIEKMGFLKSYCIHQLKESQLLCSYAVLDKIYQNKFSVFCLCISHLEVMFQYCLDDSA